ncbi:MAG: hypothetical protein GOU99_03795 [Candidatus Altiarchaeota archaeon]|nr:hypothetical protein [Candidatus Altiarchaeota archaeon]
MKAQIIIEPLFVLFLLPYLFFFQSEKIIMVRETAEMTNDLAQTLLYSDCLPTNPTCIQPFVRELNEKFAIWVDGVQYIECRYEFKYCTTRTGKKLQEVSVCAAACSH